MFELRVDQVAPSKGYSETHYYYFMTLESLFNMLELMIAASKGIKMEYSIKEMNEDVEN